MRRWLPALLTGLILATAWAVPVISRTPSWVAESSQVSATYGFAASRAGDVNGDGFGDVLVGAYAYDNGESDEGRIFGYLGSAAGLSTTAAWSVDGDQPTAQLGTAVSRAGDLNGDGFSDVLALAYGYDNGETNEGRAYAFLGSSAGLSTTPAWSVEGQQLSATASLISVFPSSGVAGGGDLNGDGFSDAAVGYGTYDNGETDEGRVFVYPGSAAGLSTTAAWVLEGGQTSASFGCSLALAQDLNGDGFSDLLVGSYLYDNGEADEGRAWAYHGASGGLSTTAAWYVEGDQSAAQLGWIVSSGDVDKDGFSDALVLASRYDNGQTDEGRVYVFRGSASGLSTTASWSAEGNQTSAAFFVVSMAAAAAGDLNGDGFSDVLAGWAGYDNGETNEGRVLLYHGGPSGLSTSASWTVEGDQTTARLGMGLAAAGDVNGDGFSEVLAGSAVYDNGESDEGRAFLWHGEGQHAMLVPEPGQEGGNLLGKAFARAGCFLTCARR